MNKKKFRKRVLLLGPIVIGLALLVSNKPQKVEDIGCNYSPITTDKQAIFEGVKIGSSLLANEPGSEKVLGTSYKEERWIEVDLSDQKLYAWDGGTLFLETLVSTGLPWTKTPVGEYRIWIKLRSTKMEGGSGANYYYLPNVPYVMFFGNENVPNWKGYGLHGTYWHNDFGTPKSHGCVNLPTPIAEQLFGWVSSEEPGTKVVIHD